MVFTIFNGVRSYNTTGSPTLERFPMVANNDEFGARTELESSSGSGAIYRIERLQEDGVAEAGRFPYSIKILLEAALRQ